MMAVGKWLCLCFFFQAEDGIRDYKVTGVQTCALPISIRPNRSRYAVERAVDELADEKPRRIDRAGHGGAALGNDFEATLDVVGLVAHQDDQPMTPGFRFGEGSFDQLIADAALAKRRLHGEGPKQERLGLADANRQQTYRADQQRADTRGEREIESMADALAQPVRRLGISTRTERD